MKASNKLRRATRQLAKAGVAEKALRNCEGFGQPRPITVRSPAPWNHGRMRLAM